ncbi:MAG TPA: GNAT family N-acetyltransferase [Terracidiphilus sp.]|jgi:GNAT superfamily N-acetyltransferase|nr:GNAT family N-acetyltransferase [Terracidiphilus sp.]
MLFDLALARRLEAAEGFAAAQFALARCRLSPESGSEIARIAGADVIFDGPDSPVTQTFGLGLFEEATPRALDEIEQFFSERGAPVQHEVCPLSGVAILDLLCSRGYRPIEIANVLYQPVLPQPHQDDATVRVIGPDDAELWTGISARGWCHEHPELEEFMHQVGALLTSRQGSACFLAEIDGEPAAAASLFLYEGAALFAGASTVPEKRRRGLQSTLLQARMRYARQHGSDLAVMVAEPGSNSHRNAQRQGFQVAYTRLKWRKG